MARFIQHEPCPSCGSRDNLGRFDDGGAFCFGCHYVERAKHAPMRNMGAEGGEKYHHALPEDVSTNYGPKAVEWLASFHMDVPTAIQMGLVWSERRQQLIFQLGNVWQARNFQEGSKSKNFTSGDVNECLHIYKSRSGLGIPYVATGGDTPEAVYDGVPDRGLPLVITEDPVSAIRTALAVPQGASLPLLGSHLAAARLNDIAGLYDDMVVWLDSDKLKEARSISHRFQMVGCKSRTIYTELDPKCYTDQEIRECLNG